IDTPGEGATVSGTVVNFGWVVTPQPNIIPTDGSTITVFISGACGGVPLTCGPTAIAGHPTYNSPRSDIQTYFPGYRNTNGAVGSFVFDSTKLSNGIHSIAWVAVDNVGNAGGLGSRYFFVQN